MSFPKDFVWGSATASYQVEGAAFEDGKGLSVWDRFSHEPGRVYQNQTGDIACDHYHRFQEDVALMKSLGLPAYRFSVSWPRILPEGTGRVNQKGVDFYNALIDALLENSIRPLMTLFHWDYPAALQRLGAWENPDSSSWFEEYSALCAKLFGDRVKDFFTLNEPQCFIGLGYAIGDHAPGLALPESSTAVMTHNVLLSHGRAVRTLRSLVPDARIGYAPCSQPPLPASNAPENVRAARKAYFSTNASYPQSLFSVAWWSDPALLGQYPEDVLNRVERFLPATWQEDLKTICQPLDFYGQNIYKGFLVQAAENEQGWERLPYPAGTAKTAIQWPVTPDALYWGPYFLYERYHTPIIITENGLSCHDTVSLDGKVHDPNREDFLHRYLLAFRKAIEDGVKGYGYLQWSFMDNFEWANGYNDRFGMVYLDYQTQRRIVKDSALWYKRVIETNGECL